MSFFNCIFSEWTLLIVAIVFVIYKWSTSTFDYFANRNVPFVKPIPLFGNLHGIMFQTEPFFETIINYCEKFKNNSFFGFFEMRNPNLVIKSPDLIKQITIKDFDHFPNHRAAVDVDDEPLFCNSLIALKDQKWKDMRTILSPAFTGSKMRQMFQLVEECSDDAITYLNEEAASNKPLEVEMKDFVTHFTNDVIATCAFGLKINSLLEKDNEFYKMGKKVTTFEGWLILKFFLFANFSKIMKFFNMKLFDQTFCTYFKRIVLDTVKYRTEHNVIRPDMINLLLEVRKGTLKYSENNQDEEDEGFATVKESTKGSKTSKHELTDMELAGQCFIFFIAGFDTTSVLMCFCAYELMLNPEIQKRLQEEIDEFRKELNGGPLTYEIIQKMKYMDMVVSETLRKWPPVTVLDRVCTKPYDLVDPITGAKVHIPVGQTIWIAGTSIHRNPEYYPDPEKFDPERFSEENKHNIKPFTYMPFGLGPRNCIGSRFALMETKALLFHVLYKFNFEVSSKTKIPIRLMTAGFQIGSKDGFWVQLTPRN